MQSKNKNLVLMIIQIQRELELTHFLCCLFENTFFISERVLINYIVFSLNQHKTIKISSYINNYTLLSEELRKCFHSCVCALTTAASLICCFLLVGKYGMGSYKTVLGIGNAPRT